MPQKKNDYICVFPDIDYHAEFDELSVQGVSPVMLAFVRERAAFVPAMENIFTLQDLEADIRNGVLRYDDTHDDVLLQDIFHKIQIWGGEHGRYIYVQGPVFDWNDIGPCYRRLVTACLDDGRTAESLARKAKAMNVAMQMQERRLGLSFITKHVHFWTSVTRGENALPIFDDIMARSLKLRPKWEHLPIYWQGMEDKARSLGISIDALERQLFNYFRGIARQ